MPRLLVGISGIVALVVGILVMQESPLDFTVGGAFGGIVAQLGTTLQPAISMGLAAALDIAAGAVIVRLIRWSPYSSLSEAMLGGLMGAVAKDTVLLLGLGSIGHLTGLALALVDAALICVGLFLRPFLQRRDASQRPDRDAVASSIAGAGVLLPVLVWCIPVALQLASPVVPFLDVLPNHVAPVEHIRAFASWDELAVSPSPIYGPSRLFIGYVSFLGTLSGLTSLPAVLAVAAFALPLAVLVAAGGYHLCRMLAGPSAAYWSLLTVPLTFTFLRIPDARATVLAFPLAAAALALTLPERLDERRRSSLAGRSRPVLMAMAIGAAMTVHPVIGVFAAATVALLGLTRGTSLRRAILAGLAGGAAVALPQAAIMLGVETPAWAGLPAWPVGLALAAWLGGPGPRRGELTELAPGPSLTLGWFVVGLVALLGTVGAGAYAVLYLDPDAPDKLATSLISTILDHPMLIIGLLLAMVVVRSLGAWLLLGAAVLIGLGAMGAANLTPTETLLGRSIHFEVPKSVGYWLPWAVALAGALGLGWVWSRDAWPVLARSAIAAAFVVAAAFPQRIASVEVAGIEEHRYAESAAIALSEAENGYWLGYRDTRRLVDLDGAALIAAIRAEQAADRIGPRTTLLHLAPSFQQWVVTPLGVMAGVIETSATPDPEDSLHTAGGRLRDIADLPSLLSEDFDYVVVEGLATSAGHDAAIARAGYDVVAEGAVWRLFARA